MDLLYYPNPILKQPCPPVPLRDEEGQFTGPGETIYSLKNTTDQMISLMYQHQGRGLAAPQVGIPYNFFVCILGKDNPTIFINPKIVGKSKEKIKTAEGCLSIPNITANLNCRYKQIKIEAETIDNKKTEMLLESYDAVVCQHEVDHAFGITLFQRMGSAQRQLKLNIYRKKRK